MKKRSILLADDEEVVLLSLEKQLAVMGYEVTAVASGEEAIEKLKSNVYDLVITDLTMEGLSGIEVLKASKAIDPYLKVIILTGYASLETAIDAVRLKADDYITKPCDKRELEFRVKKCMINLELEEKIRRLEKFLPLCAMCHSVCDSFNREPFEGEWMPIETFLEKKSSKIPYMSYCPDCKERTQKEVKELQNGNN